MKRYIRSWLLFVSDISLIVFSFYVAVWLRFDLSFDQPQHFLELTRFMPLIILVHVIFFRLFKIDKSLWKQASIEEALRVAFAMLLAFVVTYILLHLILSIGLPRSILPIGFLIGLFSMEFSRFLYRIYRHMIMQNGGKHKERTLIVGAGDAGVMLLNELLFNKRFEHNIIGFIDDDPVKKGRMIRGFPILGNTKQIEEIVIKYAVEAIFIAIPSASLKRQREIVEQCYKTPTKVQILRGSTDMLTSTNLIKNVKPIDIEDLLGRKEIKLDNDQIKDLITDQVVMVTGAAGSIGSELCRQLIDYKPSKLVMVDINENGMYDFQSEIKIKQYNGRINGSTKFVSLIASITDAKSIDHILAKHQPSILFHAAAHKHVPLMEDVPLQAIKNNIIGSKTLMDAAIKNKVATYVSISTDKAVNPTNVMGATKRYVEKMIQAYKKVDQTRFVAVRFGNVLGSNGSVIPLFKRQIESGGPITITHKDIVRYFMTIPEAVSLVLQSATYGNGGEIFVLDMGDPVKIVDLAEKMIMLSGLKPYEDIPIVFTGLRPGEKLYEELILDYEEMGKTPNENIFVAKPYTFPMEKIENDLKLFQSAISECPPHHEVKKILQKCVSTYKPTRLRMDVAERLTI